MDSIQLPAVLLVLGSVLIYSGFGVSPWGIYTEDNIEAKSMLLAAQPGRWRIGQLLVIAGGLGVVAGALSLIPSFQASRAGFLAGIAAAVFAAAHIFWLWELGLRTARPQLFANNELSGWLYGTYSILILLALASFGAAFWLQGAHTVLGIGLAAGALLVLAATLLARGVPPFVYYAMTMITGLVLIF